MENIVPFIDTTREVPIDTNTAVFYVLHYIAIFEAAINLFGFYVIAFHTPQSMRNYGRALSAYQIFGFVSVGHMVTLMVTMFIVRHQTILPQEHALKMRPGRLAIFYSLLQIWPYLHFTTIMIYTFYNDDQDSIKSYYADVSIPMITLLFPVLASIYIFVSKNLALVGLVPLGLVLFSLHGLLSTIVTLSLYRPYYAYVEQIVWNLLAKILPCIFAPRTFAMGETTTVVPGGSDRRFSLAARIAKTSFTRSSAVQSTF
ncbi:unnamed protein product, partial [Mesorhabditis belari]|uniref:Uncharacterized protein n=1 Tax=Mesorhabditis belari TaxID=2138241 RepID=A0AAF3F715_9BILA